ncbi:MAG: Gfo/Idh/MocA family oxidoreductase [Deinococcus sp.]|nr:Gfo/Idh/MocA family oxidoreductase [Deinococcus sp.]
MKVAVIGAGNWGKNLVRNFHGLGALVAVAEVSPDLLKALAVQYPGVSLYQDYRLLLQSEVPAVAITTPVRSHYQMAKEALLAGKDVFVEKPMTLSVREAEELVALAQDHQRILMVGHLLLYQPAVQWIKAYLDSGALGRVHSLHQERLNLGRVRTVENVLWSLGVHDIAVLLYLVGLAPSHVKTTGQRVLQPGVEDDVYLHLEFPRGIQAHLHTSWLWPEKRRRLVVIGSKGMLTYDEVDQTVTLHHKGIGPDLVHRDEGSEVVYQGNGEPLQLELQHFLRAIHDRRSPLSDGASGVQVIRVLEEATQFLSGVSA